MKILVLGATGQVGQALTNGLSQTEHQVCVLVRRRIAACNSRRMSRFSSAPISRRMSSGPP